MIVLIPVLAKSRNFERSSSCQANLKQWGVIFAMYAEGNKKLYPRCATKDEQTNTRKPQHGFVSAPYGPSIYPDYCNDLKMFFCPSSTLTHEDYLKEPGCRWCNVETGKLDPRNFDDASYTYSGWISIDDQEFAGVVACRLFLSHSDAKDLPEVAERDFDFEELGGTERLQAILYAEAKKQPGNLCAELPKLSGNRYWSDEDSLSIQRVHKGLTVRDIGGDTDSIQAEVPVMWDRASDTPGDAPHKTRTTAYGRNALFLDGHVEFMDTRYWRLHEALERLAD
jgi:prepilin-type processing-associated H-X9-DG protein